MEQGLLFEDAPAQRTFTIKKKHRLFGLVTAIALTGIGFYAMGPDMRTQISTQIGIHPLFFAAKPVFEFVEFSAYSWNGAANGIISKLKSAGVKRGQIVSIDAHNIGCAGDAMFSAHYSRDFPDQGELNITYTAQNAQYSWNEFYNRAGAHVDTTDIIDITGSCNSDGAVMYNFYYSRPASNNNVDYVSHLEARAGSWNGAANAIIYKLKAQSVQRGQIISIDAHTKDPYGDAIFSAHYDKGLPGYGPLDIGYFAQNTGHLGAAHYSWAAGQATTSLLDITMSVNEFGSVTYVFYYM